MAAMHLKKNDDMAGSISPSELIHLSSILNRKSLLPMVTILCSHCI